VRRLRVSVRDSRPDIMYVIGINVRPGRGRYRSTNIVTLSPRFQLHNKSTYQLQFAQRCFATTLVSYHSLGCGTFVISPSRIFGVQ
jgi:vacuolar protein sorting-associated protein 13D